MLTPYVLWTLIAAVLAVFLAEAAGGSFDEDGDFQGWYDFSVSCTSDGWKLRVENESKSGSDWHELYYNHLDFGLSRPLCSWFEAGINYRQVETLNDGEWDKQHRAHMNGIFKWGMRGWTFSDRNRLEFRDFEFGQDKWRYRNRLTAYLPVAFADGKIKPYLSDEIFVDLHGDGLGNNRAYAGTEIKLLNRLKTDVSYVWQTKYCNAEWSDTHAIQLKGELTF